MMPQAALTAALATMTVMLWLLWSDSIRPHRPTPILYAVRVALFLIVAGVHIVNLVRSPEVFSGTARVLTIAAILIGIIGAGYFAKKLARR